MILFKTILQKFDSQGEKTGWTYLVVSAEQAAALKPGKKTSFRIKGSIDGLAVEKLALMPMGDGTFILPVNGTIRKAIRKGKGDEVSVAFEPDDEPLPIDADFLDCLHDEPKAIKTFENFPKGHQNYFSKWIQSAKTEATKAKRIAMAVNALAKGLGFPEMMRAAKAEKKALGL